MTTGLAVGALAASAFLRTTGTGLLDPKRFRD
jgi:hypothetical protein